MFLLCHLHGVWEWACIFMVIYLGCHWVQILLLWLYSPEFFFALCTLVFFPLSQILFLSEKVFLFSLPQMLGSVSYVKSGTIYEGINGVKYSGFPLIFHSEKLLETVQTFEKKKIICGISGIF